MLDFHEKRKLKSFLYSWPVIGVLLFVSCAFSVSVYERYSIERTMAARREALAIELKELEQQAASLEASVERLKSDRGIEEEIRDRYQVSKKGEQIVVIVDDTKAAKGTTTLGEPEKKGYFDFLWR